eukprot:TRINITY_DN19983_c0_g1_i1.p1 TRINITY_DN19983_c0_g1~~TRINITY_DN19983_c0_g1_i1.p1  ORF type:complete len:866 (-),score=173.31 TRINITY_DN19983_c0_g1_i1:234-2831(-)
MVPIDGVTPRRSASVGQRERTSSSGGGQRQQDLLNVVRGLVDAVYGGDAEVVVTLPAAPASRPTGRRPNGRRATSTGIAAESLPEMTPSSCRRTLTPRRAESTPIEPVATNQPTPAVSSSSSRSRPSLGVVAAAATPSTGGQETAELQAHAKLLLGSLFDTPLTDEAITALLAEYSELAWLASCLKRCPMPPGWTSFWDEKAGQMRFVDTNSGNGTERPPRLRQFEELAALMLQWRRHPAAAKEVAAALGDFCEARLDEAKRARTVWQGPHKDPSTGVEYWYCPANGHSCWGDPGMASEFTGRIAARLKQAMPVDDASKAAPFGGSSLAARANSVARKAREAAEAPAQPCDQDGKNRWLPQGFGGAATNAAAVRSGSRDANGRQPSLGAAGGRGAAGEGAEQRASPPVRQACTPRGSRPSTSQSQQQEDPAGQGVNFRPPTSQTLEVRNMMAQIVSACGKAPGPSADSRCRPLGTARDAAAEASVAADASADPRGRSRQRAAPTRPELPVYRSPSAGHMEGEVDVADPCSPPVSRSVRPSSGRTREKCGGSSLRAFALQAALQGDQAAQVGSSGGPAEGDREAAPVSGSRPRGAKASVEAAMCSPMKGPVPGVAADMRPRTRRGGQPPGGRPSSGSRQSSKGSQAPPTPRNTAVDFKPGAAACGDAQLGTPRRFAGVLSSDVISAALGHLVEEDTSGIVEHFDLSPGEVPGSPSLMSVGDITPPPARSDDADADSPSILVVEGPERTQAEGQRSPAKSFLPAIDEGSTPCRPLSARQRPIRCGNPVPLTARGAARCASQGALQPITAREVPSKSSKAADKEPRSSRTPSKSAAQKTTKRAAGAARPGGCVAADLASRLEAAAGGA